MTRRGRERLAAVRRALRTPTPLGYAALMAVAAISWFAFLFT